MKFFIKLHLFHLYVDRFNEDTMSAPTGRIHSVESCGTVDGPGLRFVIFLQGCPLRCLYCHNPDSWDSSKGEERTVEEMVKEVLKYKSYIRFSKGGVTISGGEPLVQKEFVIALLTRLKEEGIHTAIDTSGITNPESVKEIYELVDLVLLDLKCSDEQIHQELTGVSNTNPIKTLNYLSSIGKPVWLRHVLVPGWTTKPELLEALAKLVSKVENLVRFEFLPFHQMGLYKWEELGLEYKLKDNERPSREEVAEAVEIFKSHGIKAIV